MEKIWLFCVLGLWWSRLWGWNIATIVVSFNYIEGVCPMWEWSLRYLKICDFDKGNSVVHWKSASFYSQFCLSIEEYMVGLSIEVWTFVSMFVRSLDGCVVVGMGLVVNKNELQSLKGGFPWIIENVDVVEWKELDVVVECCENAVVNGDDINVELFLEVEVIIH